ncbi:hypothetical protein DFH94DRAFT_176062 [Russula ochroleuca]|jgi:hypothetical protein|uniref:Uncharacterized protein n=1 Tax=Russula ochroleuca TaxID=152965 RepID=A0A9P5N4L6_9AGAM|nr:hypothetical protein DFH94DRAFT_176062 [Russula ochroleuca]
MRMSRSMIGLLYWAVLLLRHKDLFNIFFQINASAAPTLTALSSCLFHGAQCFSGPELGYCNEPTQPSHHLVMCPMHRNALLYLCRYITTSCVSKASRFLSLHRKSKRCESLIDTPSPMLTAYPQADPSRTQQNPPSPPNTRSPAQDKMQQVFLSFLPPHCLALFPFSLALGRHLPNHRHVATSILVHPVQGDHSPIFPFQLCHHHIRLPFLIHYLVLSRLSKYNAMYINLPLQLVVEGIHSQESQFLSSFHNLEHQEKPTSIISLAYWMGIIQTYAAFSYAAVYERP